MKYLESVSLSLVVMLQWIILIIIFYVFWAIANIQFFFNRVLDQLIKLIIGGIMLIGWLLEWYFLLIKTYSRLRKCSSR